MNFQEMSFALKKFWSSQGCIIQEPYDVEKGAGTMNPATFLRTLGPEPWARRLCRTVPPSGRRPLWR